MFFRGRRELRPAGRVASAEAPLEQRFEEDLFEAATVKYLNATRAVLEHSRNLKTTRGQRAARKRARALFDPGTNRMQPLALSASSSASEHVAVRVSGVPTGQ